MLLFTENAVPYRAALYRQIDTTTTDLTVVILDTSGLTKQFDPEMNTTYKWDGPMFDGLRVIIASPEFTESDGKIHGVPGYKMSNNPLRWVSKYCSVFTRSFSFAAIKTLFDVEHDIVMLENYGTFACFVIAFISKVRGKPVILRSEAYHHPYRKKTIILLKAVYLRLFYSFCRIIIYCCDKSHDYFISTGCPACKLKYLPSAVDGSYFQKKRKDLEGKRQSIRESIGVTDNNSVIFITTGRLSRRKRNLELLKSFQHANAKNSHLVIVGDGVELENLQKYCIQNNLTNVFFTGFKSQSEICNYYYASDIYTLFSDYDPSPKSVSEALEFGLPVIISKTIGNAPELCQKNGFLVDPTNVTETAGKLALLAQDAELRTMMGRHSLLLASKYSIIKNGKIIETIANNLKYDTKITKCSTHSCSPKGDQSHREEQPTC